ncbi:MAG: low molecular weight protein-tyrosine-phosphatase [Flavobacteriaceae bacterium]
MKTKILMVCLGNICRSPLAQGILESKVNPEHVFVDSAGTGAYHVGEQPDVRSIEVAKAHGIDISNQKARKFVKDDFDAFDLILVMDQSNYTNVIALAGQSSQKDKVNLILSLCGGGQNEVPDPYYGGVQGFEHVYSLLNDACDYLVKDVLK